MNLGEIDLAQAEEKHFRVEGLPADREFILGINLELGDCAIEKSDMRIALEMTDEHGNPVISENRSLHELTWSTGRDECVPAFGYVRGRAEEVPINKEGAVCMRPIITGADHGRGTYFVTRSSAAYEVSVRVYGKPTVPLGVHSAKVFIEDNGAYDSSTNRCP